MGPVLQLLLGSLSDFPLTRLLYVYRFSMCELIFSWTLRPASFAAPDTAIWMLGHFQTKQSASRAFLVHRSQPHAYFSVKGLAKM